MELYLLHTKYIFNGHCQGTLNSCVKQLMSGSLLTACFSQKRKQSMTSFYFTHFKITKICSYKALQILNQSGKALKP